jgi:hypothetical protein
MSIGRLTRVPLREVWKHEALDFTTWLRDNVDVLNDVIEGTIANVEREQSAGAFNVDLVGEDEAGNAVIIENQLERSDHDHLGKLITYLTAFEAKTAVWIVSDPRPEHIAAITWLNQSTPASFYLLKVEAVRIGDSPAAPMLTRIVGPSAEGRLVGEVKMELAGRGATLQRFWASLLDRAKQRSRLHANISPSDDQWISTGAGRSGLALSYYTRKHNGQAELAIDTGNQAENKRLFDHLALSRAAIDMEFGGSLSWERMDEKRMSRIRHIVDSGGYLDEERWPDIQDELIDAMIRLERAFRPHLDALPR